MNYWQEIVKYALLSGEKQNLNNLSIPESIQVERDAITKTSRSESEIFIKLAAMVYYYQKAGNQLPQLKALDYKNAVENEQSKIADHQTILLAKAIGENMEDVLEFFLSQCLENQLILREEYVPTILDIGKKNANIRKHLHQVIGSHGQWLVDFNEEWSYLQPGKVLDIWDSGNHHERTEALKILRTQDQQNALQILQQTWSSENASNRYIFISVLEIGLSPLDEEFLLDVLQRDKSERVKQKAFELLLQIPAEQILTAIWQFGNGFLEQKEQKGLAAMVGQQQFQINLPQRLPQPLLKAGIKMNLDIKGLTQDEAWAYQVFAAIPPERWRQKFSIHANDFLAFFAGKKALRKYLPAFLQAIRIHKDKQWTIEALNEKLRNGKNFPMQDHEFSAYLTLMTPYELEQLFDKKIYKQGIGYRSDLLNFLNNCKYPWSLEFTRKAMKELASVYKNYYYNKNEVYSLNPYIHTDFLSEWNGLASDGFQELSARLYAAVELRKKIQESFT